MIKQHTERAESDFPGTIIDVETIGGFGKQSDSRRFCGLKLVIFGYIDCSALAIHCAIGEASIDELGETVTRILPGLAKPFAAFNCNFEEGVLYYNIHQEIQFDRELQWGRQSKGQVVQYLGINNYDDPFNDDGKRCMEAWQDGDFDAAIRHNRSCLLKE